MSFFGCLIVSYVTVDDAELFYYFIESQGNPREDPIFLWMSGGPGCSSFNGLIYEIGNIEELSLFLGVSSMNPFHLLVFILHLLSAVLFFLVPGCPLKY